MAIMYIYIYIYFSCQVHAGVFAAGEDDPRRDARVALAAARRRVLAGVRLCFSAVVPLGAAAPQAHVLWRLAEQVRASSWVISGT